MTNCPEYREPISSWSISSVERDAPVAVIDDRNFGGAIPGRNAMVWYVIRSLGLASLASAASCADSGCGYHTHSRWTWIEDSE